MNVQKSLSDAIQNMDVQLTKNLLKKIGTPIPSTIIKIIKTGMTDAATTLNVEMYKTLVEYYNPEQSDIEKISIFLGYNTPAHFRRSSVQIFKIALEKGVKVNDEIIKNSSADYNLMELIIKKGAVKINENFILSTLASRDDSLLKIVLTHSTISPLYILKNIIPTIKHYFVNVSAILIIIGLVPNYPLLSQKTFNALLDVHYYFKENIIKALLTHPAFGKIKINEGLINKVIKSGNKGLLTFIVKEKKVDATDFKIHDDTIKSVIVMNKPDLLTWILKKSNTNPLHVLQIIQKFQRRLFDVIMIIIKHIPQSMVVTESTSQKVVRQLIKHMIKNKYSSTHINEIVEAMLTHPAFSKLLTMKNLQSLINELDKRKSVLETLKDENTKYINTLSNRDIEILKSYSEDEVPFQEALKKLLKNPESKISHKHLHNLVGPLQKIILNSPPLTGEIKVYRGTTDDPPMNKLKVGDLFKNPIFVSTSYNKKSAMVFTGKNCCLLIITVPKHQSVLYLSDISSFKEESEILLPAGTVFRVTHTKQTGNMKQINLICEYCEKDLFKQYPKVQQQLNNYLF